MPGTALDLCARAQNRPLWVVDRIAKELCVVEDMQPMFTNRERMTLLAYTDKLSKSIGACERIHQTVRVVRCSTNILDFMNYHTQYFHFLLGGSSELR